LGMSSAASFTSAPIGVFDSGVGGLTVCHAIQRLLPAEPIYYLADNARAPYGSQDAARVRAYSLELAEQLLGAGAKLIVVACNTATSAAIDHLRRTFPSVPFVGMEPAIKPAAEQSARGRVGVMATELTLKSARFRSLVERFAPDVQLNTDPCRGLVPLIETGDWTAPALQQSLVDILHPMLLERVDTLVLGCTHYPLVEAQIREIVGPDIQIINPAPAAARQVVRLLTDRKLLAPSTEQFPLARFYSTGSAVPLATALGALGWRWRLVAPTAATTLYTAPDH